MLNQVIRCVDEANGTTTLTNSSTTLSSQFTDADQVDSWAVESMAKLNNNGLMSGSGNTLSPKKQHQRAGGHHPDPGPVQQVLNRLKLIQKQPPSGGCFSLSKNLCLDESARVLAGELEGAQPASSGIKCPDCLASQGVQRAQRGLFRR